MLKPFDPADLLEMIKKLITDKKNEYLTMFREVEQAKQNTPQFKYQNPNGW
jgi:DNA-binding response OmpR family regulator